MKSEKFFSFRNDLSTNRKNNESPFNKLEFAESLIKYSSKCENSSNYVDYFKFDQIDENSCKIDLRNDQSSHGQANQYIFLRIMSILIVFFIIGFVFCTASALNNRNRLANLENINKFHSLPHDHKIAEKYSLYKNSTFFKDHSSSNNAVRIKPIYFQFIANKSPHFSANQINHHSFFLKNPIHKHANNRHFARPLSIQQYNYLQRYTLNNSTAYCNDGTSASYYFRKGKNSKWIIFLEGGWFCYSTFSCYQRWLQMRNFMTSVHWPEKKIMNGILSAKKEENTFYYNANHVYIGYCSSDGWSGNKPAKSSKDLHFSGSLIIEEVIKDLFSKGLNDASLVIMSGSSAGASGVLINLDRITDLITSINQKAKVLGLIDSGWFLDNIPFKNMDFNNLMFKKKDNSCINDQLCLPIESIKKGFKYWNSRIPESCENIYPDEPWRCFFGHRLLPTMKTPIFVIQFLFDEAQMSADNVPIPTTKAHWHYIYKMGLQTRNSLKNVSGLFSPSCVSHTILIKKSWNQIKINGITLQEAIKCWEFKQMNDYKKLDLLNLHQRRRLKSNAMTNEVDLISPSLHSSNYYYTNAFSNVFDFRETNSIFNQLFKSKKSKKLRKKKQIQRLNNDLNLKHCSMRLIDDCTFPQCNSQCPSLKNIFTGKEINFFDLLGTFGFSS